MHEKFKLNTDTYIKFVMLGLGVPDSLPPIYKEILIIRKVLFSFVSIMIGQKLPKGISAPSAGTLGYVFALWEIFCISKALSPIFLVFNLV